MKNIVINAAEGRIDRVFKNGSVRTNVGTVRGTGHIHLKVNGKLVQAHRLIYAFVHGPIPSCMEIDHINGNRTDDRIANLRAVTRGGNMQNQRRAHANNTSGLLGVYYKPKNKKWAAQIQANKKRMNLGLFKTAEEAHTAYLKAKRELHDTCTI